MTTILQHLKNLPLHELDEIADFLVQRMHDKDLCIAATPSVMTEVRTEIADANLQDNLVLYKAILRTRDDWEKSR